MSKYQGRELLTPEERERLTRMPTDISEWDLGASFTLTPHDLEIVNQHRRDHNRLGFAVQLCVLRFTGWPLSEVKIVPLPFSNT
jgi:TnpA family transposase